MPPDEEDDDLEALVDPEKITHPVFQDLPDGISEDWTHGVVIGGMATETSDIVVAEAYWWAAQQLIEPALHSREPFLYSYPRAAFGEINTYVRYRLTQHLRRRSQRPYRPPEGVSFYEQISDLGW